MSNSMKSFYATIIVSFETVFSKDQKHRKSAMETKRSERPALIKFFDAIHSVLEN